MTTPPSASPVLVNHRITVAPAAGRDARLAAFTFPRWRFAVTPQDGGDEPDPHLPSPFAALVASDGDTPVGMALLVDNPDYDNARLCSISVARAYRRQGIGTALATAAAELAKSLGAKQLQAMHNDRLPSRIAYETLLRSCSWNPPRPERVRVFGRADWVTAAAAEWAPILARLVRQGWRATLWTELSTDEQARFAATVATAPELLRPVSEPNFDPVCLALHRHDEIVGWVQGILELTPNHVYYPVGYVVPSLQGNGWLIAGLMDACRRQLAALGPDSVCHYQTADDNLAMQRFMLRRLDGRPGFLRIDTQYFTEKNLV